MTIKVLVNGARGRMGTVAVKAVSEDRALKLVAATDVNDNLRQSIIDSEAQVVIDLTVASVAYEMALTIIEAGAHPVIGTSGFLPQQIATLTELCDKKSLGGIIAPNFSISAVLMMKYSKEIARYMPEAEIIELHHDGKQDSPSGTAVKTAELIAQGRKESTKFKRGHEVIQAARGAEHKEVAIHAVRLPGLNAHQEVIFGGLGQILTLRSDVLNRDAYIPGICLAAKEVVNLKTLLYGLENLL